MRRVLLVFLGLLLIFLIGATWYAYDRGFTRKWRNSVTNEFRKRGVEVSLRRLTLDPFRGLVARELKVYDTRDRRRLLAEIDEVILQVNYANLARGATFLDALDLRDATLSLPLDVSDPRSTRLEVSKLNARLFLPPQQIYLSRAEAELFGIRVSVSGRLINPQAFRPRTDVATPPELVVAMNRAIEELKALRFEGDAPVLTIAFSGDLAEAKQVAIDLRLAGEKIRRDSYFVQSLQLAARYRAGVLDCQQLAVTDSTGALYLSGSFESELQTAELRLRSTLDLQALAHAFRLFPQLEEFVFYSPPSIELSGGATFGARPEFKLQSHLALGRFAFRSVVFERGAADLSWDGSRWAAREVQLVHSSGEVTGDVMQLPGDFRSRLKSTINPKVLQSLVSGKGAEILSLFDFRESPALEAEARGTAPTLDDCVVKGKLEAGAGSFRGIAAEKLTANLSYANRVLTLAPFRVDRAEGSGSGGLALDFKRNEVRLEKIHANLHPQEAILWVEPKLLPDIVPYRFGKRPPNLFLDGVVNTKHGKSTRLSIDVEAPGGMEYTFLQKNLSVTNLSGKLLFTSDRLRISDFSGNIFGGRVTGAAEVSTLRERPGHRASIQVQDLNFASLTKLYFNYDDSQGRLFGRYDFTGRGDDARAMEGRGEFSVSDGNVFAIPFLGPFSGILNSIVPGMGYNVARKASSEFTIEGGVVNVPDLVVEGKGFSMLGGGKLWFLDDRMDFNMRINAQGLPGVLLFPVSKLFEYTADEKLSKPVWRPRALRGL